MQETNSQDSQPPSRFIHHHALFTAVALICDIRLGLILACELGIIASSADRGAVAVPLLGLSINWATLRVFNKHPDLIVDNWIYICTDLVITCVITSTLPATFPGGLALSLAYLIASSVLIGLVSQAFWASLWSVGATLSLALLKLHDASISTVVAATMVAGIFFSVLLGNRLNSQFMEISCLSAEAAFARAEERATAERLTIARDLHDSLAKSVHGIRMLAESLESSLSAENHPETPLSHTLLESADEASREARLVLDGLRSGGGEDIVGALVEEATRWGARTGISISINHTDSNAPLPCSTEAMWQLQRILGEILANIEKHAHATSVDLSILHDDSCFRLDVRDNGIGLGKDVKDLYREGHYGLAGLKERSLTLNGAFSIDSLSELTAGTRVRLRVPIASLHTTTNKEKII
ncbi:two-component sensor histidine kinase [Actinomyces johnsonii]|nr:two-component sensor histidine kinase [Actinomyces johnsonii]